MIRNRETMESAKLSANEVYGLVQAYNKGQCSFDRLLENIADRMEEYAEKRPVVGYIASKTITDILIQVNDSKKKNPNGYEYDCKLHQNEISTLERIIKTL